MSNRIALASEDEPDKHIKTFQEFKEWERTKHGESIDCMGGEDAWADLYQE